MNEEYYKAENAEEIVWLRLNRLKTVALCEKLIQRKLEVVPNTAISQEIIKAKAVGLSSAINSAIGYLETKTPALNVRILLRYYSLMQLTIAEQVSSANNLDDLKTIQKHTAGGHGLGTLFNSDGKFPNEFFIFPLQGGHFYSYVKNLGLNMKEVAFSKRPHKLEDVTESDKLVSLSDILRRIPELNNVIEEYLDVAPLAFHVGYSNKNMHDSSQRMKRQFDAGNLFNGKPEVLPENITSNIAFYSESKKITPEYLSSLQLPVVDFEMYKNPTFNNQEIIGKLNHPSNIQWWQAFNTYSSSHATSTYAVPLWTSEYDSIVTNYAVLYGLSIIVRYMPDLWYRLTTGDLNHIGSLIEYYISVIDHVLPIQMLERITGSKIAIHNPGSFFGQI